MDDLSDDEEILQHTFGAQPSVDLSLSPDPHGSLPVFYKFSKRQPLRGYSTENDFFVSTKTSKLVLTKRLRTRLASSSIPITLHALGHATSIAVDVAQFLCSESFGDLTLSVTTSTETTIDDYVLIRPSPTSLADPNRMEIEGQALANPLPEHIAQVRHVSAIHIAISHTKTAPKKKIPKVNVLSE